MKKQEMEEKAKAVAQAIVNEDCGEYALAMREADMASMKRGDVIAFRELVHFYADELKPTRHIVAITHNQS